MDETFNPRLCENRHEHIGRAFERLDARMIKIENRFLAIITILIMNLLGVAGTLLVLLVRA